MDKNQESSGIVACNCGDLFSSGKVLFMIFIFTVGLLIGMSLGSKCSSKQGMMGKGGCCCMGKMMPCPQGSMAEMKK